MEWISVLDKLPPQDGYSLVVWSGAVQHVTWFRIGEHLHSGDFQIDVDDEKFTHWMPLPELPKEKP